MDKLIYRKIIKLILFFSIFALIFAYYVEFALGHKPCKLCLLERIPYFITIFIIIILSFFQNFEKILFGLLGIIFLIATILSIYHVGIEYGIFQESTMCSSNSNLNILDKKELLKNLTKETISCKNVTFRILGHSLATINTFISLVISSITLTIFFKYEKK